MKLKKKWPKNKSLYEIKVYRLQRETYPCPSYLPHELSHCSSFPVGNRRESRGRLEKAEVPDREEGRSSSVNSA